MDPLIPYFSCFVMGLTLGLLGAGGSILSVPILVFLFGVSPWIATSNSLMLVGLLALYLSIRSFKRHEISFDRLLRFGFGGVLGVYFARTYVRSLVPEVVAVGEVMITRDSLIMILFAVLMIAASVVMLRSRPQEPKALAPSSDQQTNVRFLGTLGLVSGLVAGFVGAGGGFIIVPMLVIFGSLPMREAVGTSVGIIALQSLIGVGLDRAGWAALDFQLLAPILLASLLGSVVGERVRHRVPQGFLKTMFGIFVFFTGVFILVQEFRR